MADLNDILSGEPSEPAEPVEPTEPQEPAPPTEPEPEPVITGEPNTDPVPPTDPTPEPEEVKGLRAAAAAERKKRQELEAEREALRQEVELARQQLAQRRTEPEEEPPYIDPDVEQRFTATEAKLEERLVQTKIMMSREFAMDKYPDYAEKEAEFIQMARSNPALVDQMRASANPAAFAYKTVTDLQQIQKLREIGDPVAYENSLRERIEAEVRAKVAAEQEEAKKQATEAAIRAKLPKSGFAEERSTGTARATTKTYDGPTPLTSILAR